VDLLSLKNERSARGEGRKASSGKKESLRTEKLEKNFKEPGGQHVPEGNVKNTQNNYRSGDYLKKLDGKAKVPLWPRGKETWKTVSPRTQEPFEHTLRVRGGGRRNAVTKTRIRAHLHPGKRKKSVQDAAKKCRRPSNFLGGTLQRVETIEKGSKVPA